MGRARRSFLIAGRFLTRWPMPDPGLPTAEQLGQAALFYPLIGLLLGALLAGLALLLRDAPPLPAAALLLIIWVWSTGGLHLDGLADCADAWVGGLGSRERTLEILKDPRSGAMGVVALLLVLIGKFAGLAALLDVPSRAGVWALLCVPALGRAQLLALTLTTPYARPEGMGAAMQRHLPRRAASAVLMLTWAFVLLPLSALSWVAVVALSVPALLVFVRWRRSLRQRLGGYTGDGAGALVELTETGMLLALGLLLPVTA